MTSFRQHTLSVLSSALACIGSAALSAQAPTAQPGLRLFGPIQGTDTYLVDEAQQIVHTWTSTYTPGVSCYLDNDGNLLRTITTVTAPAGLNGGGGGIQRIALDGTLLWDWRYEGPGFLQHHDIEVMPNDNILVIVWEDIPNSTAIDEGRDPSLLDTTPFRPDKIIEVRQTGPTTADIVWEWRVWDHLIQDFDPTKNNYGVVADNPGKIDLNYPPVVATAGDFTHFNSVRYDPVYDRIVLSAREQDELWVIDHSTTTAEAAGSTGGNWGRGGDLLYRWGNPEAYDRGTPADQKLFGQHGPMVIPEGYPGAGNILVFNNQDPTLTKVIEIVPPLDVNGAFVLAPGAAYGPAAPIWSYGNPFFSSSFISNAERLPNGNTLICSGVQGRIFEVNNAGQLAAEYITGGQLVFQAHYYDRSLWLDQRELSISAGGVATFDLIAGTPRANHVYLLAGSTSGTTPGFSLGAYHLPLNVDGYFFTTISAANIYPFGNTTGVLDSDGRMQATFTLPASVLPPEAAGYEFSHAALCIDPNTGGASWTSNAVTFTLVP